MKFGRMRLDPHIHTEYSIDGVNRPEDILSHIKRSNMLDAIVFTDHNKIFPRKKSEELTKEYGILVIPGIELGRLETGKHILALNVDGLDVNRLLRSNDPYEAVECISSNGGVSVAAHPLPRGYSNFSDIGFDAVEMINGGSPINNSTIKNPCNIPGLGSSDAHIKRHLGRAWTFIEDMTVESFNEYTGPSDIRRYTEEVMERIRKGLCFARGEPSQDASYLNYGYMVGKKYFTKSFKTLCSLII
jgi:predicted metal-dependent phosphoesterase TrpH